MITRQWQVGELHGDDAGSPILSKVRVETTKLRKYQPAGAAVEAFDDAIPLEARVEQMPIEFVRGVQDMSLDLRLLMGRQWLKMVRSLAPAAANQFIAAYPVHVPDSSNTADAAICAYASAWAAFAAAATRCMDGAKFYFNLKQNGSDHAGDGIPSLAGLKSETQQLAERFIRWFEKLFYQPKNDSAWIPDRLEYQFAVSAPEAQGEKVLEADAYYQGHLDWYNFDVDPQRQMLGDSIANSAARGAKTFTMLPTRVTFTGMPNTRWWAFEDSRTNFGDVKPDTTDLAKLLLIEFGLVYANDWLLVPFVVPAGSIANIRGIAVTNVFGERTWVEAAGQGSNQNWQRWAMFLVSVKGNGNDPADLSLVIPPLTQQTLTNAPLEDAMLIRDEMANMVWAVEKAIPLPSGDAANGKKAAFETRAFFEQDLVRRLGAPPVPPPLAQDAKIRYRVMSTVPENWIPLIPVHVPNDNRKVQLQRGAMPRVLEGDPVQPALVRPQTSLLRPGLDQSPSLPYFVHEEEVSRAGVRVTASFHRTRWRDGRAWVWLGVRKQTGRGEGSSNLRFDRIEA